MALALHPELPPGVLGKLVVEDIAPKRAPLSKDFQAYVKAMDEILNKKVSSRKQADETLRDVLDAIPGVDGVRFYLLGTCIRTHLNIFAVTRNTAVPPDECSSTSTRKAHIVPNTIANHRGFDTGYR